jgi:hypothetical protein
LPALAAQEKSWHAISFRVIGVWIINKEFKHPQIFADMLLVCQLYYDLDIINPDHLLDFGG